MEKMYSAEGLRWFFKQTRLKAEGIKLYSVNYILAIDNIYLESKFNYMVVIKCGTYLFIYTLGHYTLTNAAEAKASLVVPRPRRMSCLVIISCSGSLFPLAETTFRQLSALLIRYQLELFAMW